MSPLLYVLLIEESKLIDSHVVFADDLVCFMRANPISLATVKNILQDFASFPGLDTKPLKSVIYFSKSVNNCDFLGSILGYPIKSLPIFNILGPPSWAGN